MTAGAPLPSVIPLGGGQLLIRDRAVLWMHRWACNAVAVARRRDGMGALPPDADELLTALDAEARAVVSSALADPARAAGSAVPPAEFRSTGGVPSSRSSDLIDTEEAATLLDCSSRYVREIALRLDGRKIRGRWLFPRAEVHHYVLHRPTKETA